MSSVAEQSSHLDSERPAYQFVLELGGAVTIDQPLEDAIFQAGCDDAILYSMDERVFLEFDREAKSLVAAVVSAIRAVEGCGKGIQVKSVVPPHAQEIGTINAALQVRNEGGDLLRELGG